MSANKDPVETVYRVGGSQQMVPYAWHKQALSDSLRPYRALAAKLRKLPVDEWSAETCGAVARIADEIDALSNKEAGK